MGASPEQLHAMLQYCMNFARTMLEESGDFYPFGASLSRAGTVGAVAGYNGEERPKPQELYQLLASAFANEARGGDLLGAALAANVNVPAKYSPKSPDGIRVHLESPGYARFVYIPYRRQKRGLLKRTTHVVFGEPISVGIVPQFFL
jgi:hypothetical protein